MMTSKANLHLLTSLSFFYLFVSVDNISPTIIDSTVAMQGRRKIFYSRGAKVLLYIRARKNFEPY